MYNMVERLKKINEKCSEEFEIESENRRRRENKNIFQKALCFVRKKKNLHDALKFNINGLNHTEKREKRIIVSLTSYPGRINAVPATIGSLLNQTMKPDLIVLWLGEEKFLNDKLPSVYDKIRECGVEVRFRPDLKSHTKYFYAFQEFPDDIIITVDDDLMYRNTLVEELYRSYEKYPDCVSALRVHKIRFNDDFTIKPYVEWIYEYSGAIGSKSHRYFATGVGGVLYPPHLLHPEVLNLSAIQTYCHNHDDLWLKVMEVMNDVKVVLAADSKKENNGSISGTQTSAQWKENVVDGGNDRQTHAVLNAYNNSREGKPSLCEQIALDD